MDPMKNAIINYLVADGKFTYEYVIRQVDLYFLDKVEGPDMSGFILFARERSPKIMEQLIGSGQASRGDSDLFEKVGNECCDEWIIMDARGKTDGYIHASNELNKILYKEVYPRLVATLPDFLKKFGVTDVSVLKRLERSLILDKGYTYQPMIVNKK